MEEILKGRDIVIVGQQAWDDDLGSNCKNIALEFSKHNRVLYVNYPMDRKTIWKRSDHPKIQKRINIIKGKEPGLIQLQHNLWNLYPETVIESINWIKIGLIYDMINKINNKRFATRISLAAQTLGFENVILFNDNDITRSFYLKEMLGVKTSIYYSRDYMIGVDYWKRQGMRLEPKLIAKSDLCVANSTYLTNYCKQYNHNSYYVGQGCETELFNSVKPDDVPEEIKQIASPKIGYVGALQSLRLDIEIIKGIAKERPSWNVILVGPEDEDFQKSDLHQIPNVHFLGPKSPVSLPKYINSFDVCINPQLVNDVTKGNYPRKIDEYLAVGKPVVATQTEAMLDFSEHVYLAQSLEDYLAFLERALEEDSEDRIAARKSFAATHTWENSVKEIYKAIKKHDNLS